jgi:hypothetical protein
MSKFTALQTEVGFLIMDMGLKPRPIREIPALSAFNRISPKLCLTV